ncbi:hypothetical protein M8818_004417 [Zalaria obscura]|uniref:Uncharacterized protein n=1 Tax=Zalaria obscura TaxID=2024903 RepID=A0ACC3SCW2_9PEZI
MHSLPVLPMVTVDSCTCSMQPIIDRLRDECMKQTSETIPPACHRLKSAMWLRWVSQLAIGGFAIVPGRRTATEAANSHLARRVVAWRRPRGFQSGPGYFRLLSTLTASDEISGPESHRLLFSGCLHDSVYL